MAEVSLQIGQAKRPEKADLVLELEPEALVDAAAGLGHQRDRVRRGRPIRVLDEVRMPRRDQGAADPVALQAALLDQAARSLLGGRILEHAAERALRRRLRRLALRK